jgi:hypothetical protein
VGNVVPLLGTSSADRNPLPQHCLFQAVAHRDEQCGPAKCKAFFGCGLPLFQLFTTLCSEATDVCQPERLKEIVAELGLGAAADSEP